MIHHFDFASSFERSRCAPDPIAMLSDGQHKLGAQAVVESSERMQTTGAHMTIYNGTHEQGSDHSAATPDDSDRSGAITQVAAAIEHGPGQTANIVTPVAGCTIAHDGYCNVFEHLTPILSKMAGHLEVVQENVDTLADSGRVSPDRVRSGVQVPATRVRALRCSSSVESLNLSEVQLRGNVETRPVSARSDVSFGSASSAFTCLSSSTSGSQNPLSPHTHARRSLTGTVSMPSLLQPKLP